MFNRIFKPAFFRGFASSFGVGVGLGGIFAWSNSQPKPKPYTLTMTTQGTLVPSQFTGIRPQQLINTEVPDLNDTKLYRLGFSRKTCPGIGISHSSLALLDEEAQSAEKWLLLGRQNSYNLKGSSYFNLQKLKFFQTTAVDNESKYELLKKLPYDVEMSTVQLSGAEIKKLVALANDNVCKTQKYDLFSSNCYSSSTYMLAQAFKLVAARKTDTAQSQQDMKSLYRLLRNAYKDNFSIGVGNNPVAADSISQAEQLMGQHRAQPKRFTPR